MLELAFVAKEPELLFTASHGCSGWSVENHVHHGQCRYRDEQWSVVYYRRILDSRTIDSFSTVWDGELNGGQGIWETTNLPCLNLPYVYWHYVGYVCDAELLSKHGVPFLPGTRLGRIRHFGSGIFAGYILRESLYPLFCIEFCILTRRRNTSWAPG